MPKILRLFLLFAFFATPMLLHAQNWSLSASTQNMCAGTFLDPGGNGNYSNNQNITGTICATGGQCVTIEFNSFDLGSSGDNLYIYDGTTTAAPTMGTYTGTGGPGVVGSSTGCVTFRFVSNNTGVAAGWSAAVTCSACYEYPGCPSVDAGLDQSICSGACVTLTAIPEQTAQTTSYTVGNIPYTPLPYNKGTDLLVGVDDIFSPVLNLGFNFCFYGTNYNQCVLGANGLISFNTALANQFNIWSTTTAIPNAGDHTNLIAAPYHDIDPSVQNRPNYINFEIVGSAPCRVAKFSWNRVPMFSCNSLYATQEILLYETTNIIETYIHNKPTCTGWNSGEAIHGIENNAGSVGTVVPGRNFPTQWTATLDAKRFTPSGAPAYTVTWYQGLTQIGTGTSIQVCPTATTTYTVRTVYTRCDGTTITVTDDVVVNVTTGITANITQSQPFTCTTAQVPLSVTANPPGSYTYTWAPGANIVSGAGTTTVNVNSSGTYTVTVSSASGCQATASINVQPATPPTASASPSPNTACATPFNGSVSATPNGFAALPAPTYAWSGPSGFTASTQNINNVAPGTYTVTITQGSCNATATATVANNAAVTASASATPNTACSTPYNGSATASGTGFTGTPTYTWAGPSGFTANTSSINNIAPGTYTVTISQGTCTATATATVANNSAVTASASATPNTACGSPYNGSASASSTGFAGTPTYTWSGPSGFTANTQNLSNIAPGTYTVTISQGGCSATATATVANNAAVTASASATPNTACGVPYNGSASASGTGFTGTPTYAWSGPSGFTANTQNLSNIGPGTYTVTITQGTCSATATATVANNAAVTASASATPNTACGVPYNGSASASGTGFAGTPTYSWSGPSGFTASTQNLSNIAPGTYTVTISQGGCSATATATVANNAAVTASASANDNTNCVAPFNGSASASSTGFTGTPTYTWSGPSGFTANTQNLSNIAPGTYTVTITQGGCSATATATVADSPTPTNASISGLSSACTSDAAPTWTASGGVTYLWSNGATTATINPPVGAGASTNTYSVTVTASNGCSDSASQTFTVNVCACPNPVTVLINNTDLAICSSENTISLSSTTTGSPTLTWSSSGSGTFSSTTAPNPIYTLSAADIAAGSVTFTVTTNDPDGAGVACQPATNNLTFNLISPTASASPTPNTNCSAPYNGGVSSSFTGLISPIYAWSGPSGFTASTQNINNVPAGTYTVTISDANCSVTATATVTNNINLSASASPINNSTCSLPFNGGINLSTSGFTNPTYAWSGPSGFTASTQNLTGLQGTAGGSTYTVTVTDGACSTTATATVLNTVVISASATPTPNTLCSAPYNGGINLSTSGFTNPTYSWSGPNGFTASTQNLSNIQGDAGAYTVTVTDGACSTTATATVLNNVVISASATPTPNTLCSAPFNGSISLTTSGFTNPTYSWSGPNGFTASTQNLSNIQGGAGTYTVTVTDGSCSTTASAVVPNNINLSASATPTPNTLCSTPFNGNITLTTSGFANPTYSWSGPSGFTSSSQNLNSVDAGTYTVTVTDGSCSTTATATVISNVVLSAAATPNPNTSCSVPYTGSISLTTSGFGNPTYSWSGPGGFTSSSQNLNNIDAGTYTVTVTDGNCSTTATATVDDNTQPDATAITIPNTRCSLPYNGSITLNTSGFATPTIAWSGPNGFSSSASNLTALAPGTYTVTVTEGNCSVTTTAIVDNVVVPPTASLVPTPNTACDFTAYNGAVDLTTDGNQFLWSNGATTQDLSNLASGTYTVTITNTASNCTTTASTVVDEMPPILNLFVVNPITITCNSVDGQEMLIATVSEPTATYQWTTSGGNIVSGANTATPYVDAVGTYFVTVTAPGGCSDNGVVNVLMQAPPTASITGPNAACAGDTVVLSAPQGFSQYLWSTGATTRNIADTLQANASFSVTVTDGYGCTASASTNVLISQPPTPAISGSLSFCQNGNTTLDAGAGYASYLWTGGATTQTLLVSSAGTYCVTVTNASGCSGNACVSVTVNSVLTPSVIGQDFCEGSSTDLDAGLGFTSYLWSNGNTTQNITVNAAGTYTVTVSDATGCTGTGAVTINQNNNPTPSISGDNSICEGTTTSLNAGTYAAYLWSDGSFSSTLTVGAGTYSVTVTDGSGCTGSATFTVVETPNPTPAITGNMPFCVGDNITLDAGSGYSSYNWQPTNTNAQTLVVTTADTYSVVVTDVNGCSGTDAVTVVTNNLPTPTISGDLGICPTESTTLTATSGFDAYIWNNGNVSDNISTTLPGAYSVTVTDSNGCEGTATTTVVQNNAAVPNIIGDNDICLGQSTSLNAGSYAQYTWLPDSQSSQVINVTPNENTSYSVTVTDSDGCTASNSVNVTVHELPTVEIGGSTTFCAGTNLFLSATFGFSNYQWDPAVGNVSDIVINAGGTYSVTVTDSNGCTASDDIEVTQSNQLNPVITGDLSICSGESTVLSAATFDNYQWSANAGSATTATITVTTAGNYCVTVSDNSGCSGTRCATVVVNPNPTPDITGSPAICPGSNSVLNPGTFASYVWQDGSFTSTYTATAAGNYNVTVTDSNGCTGTDNFTVSLNANLSPTITGDAAFCAGDNGQLDAGAGYATYLWSTSATTQNITVNATGTYSVTVADSGGCSGTDSFEVVVNPNPTPNVAGDLSICAGQSTTLTASGGVDYIWNNGAGNAAVATVSPLATTPYQVTVTDANGCSNTASATVAVNTAVAPVLNGDTNICNGDCTTLNVAGTYSTYSWSSGQNSASINVCPTANTTYNVTVTDANGCTNSGTINVTIDSNPTPSIGGSSTFCAGGNTTINAGAYAAYIWTTGETTQSLVVTTGGNYCVTVTNANGCTGSACILVSESSQLNPVIVGDPEICAGEVSTLDAGIFTQYEWSVNAGNATTQTIDVTASGTYCVTVTDGSCTGTNCFDVLVHSNPEPEVTGVVALCDGEPTTLDAGTFAGYEWSANAGGVFTQTISVSTSGTYSVTVSDVNGCTGTDDVTVNVTPNPTPTISGNLAICTGESTTLDAGLYDDYTWLPNAETSQTINATTGGTYSVTVTDSNGCSGTTTATVIENTPIVPTISGDTEICSGTSTTLNAGSYDAYAWLPNGENTQSIDVSPNNNTTYSVVVTDAAGCTASNEINVLVNALPTPQIGGSLTYCVGSSTTLSATPGFDYVWNGGETTESITVSTPGQHCVTVTDPITTCTGSVCVDVSEDTQLNPQISGDLSICAGETTTLDAGIFTGTYEWSPSGATTQTITVSANGTYCVTVSDAGGCTGSTCVDVVVNNNPTPTITGPASICASGTATLDAGTYNAYEWSANAGSSFNQTVSVNAQDTYSVTVTDNNGCVGSDNFSLTINANLTPTITGNTAICVGTNTTLDAGAGYSTYTWLPTGTGSTQTVSVSPSTNTMYSVTVTDASGCSGTADITVNINADLLPTITGDDEICAGQNTTLDAGAGYATYTWLPAGGGATQSITVTPANDTPYSVTVTDASGCSGTATFDVTVNANPTPTIDGDFIICEGESTSLDAGFYDTYVWSPAGTGNTQTVTVTPASTTTYNVTVTDNNACNGTTAATVTVEICNCTAPSAPLLTVDSAEICDGDTNTTAFVASLALNTDIVWYDGPDAATANLLGTGLSYTLVSPTTATVYAFAINNPDDGCISAGVPATLTVLPNPVAALSATPDGLCIGAASAISFSGTASPSAMYVWNFGAGAMPPIAAGAGPHNVIWTTSGEKTISLAVSDAGACSDNTTSTVAVSNLTVSVDPATSTIDLGSSIDLTATGVSELGGDITYVWTPDGTLSCDNCAMPTVTPTQAMTTYTVTAIDEYGCEALATAIVNTIYTKAVIIPNAFSPNGDGVNALFRPQGKNIAEVYLEIRNRWGNKIYAQELTNLDLEGWDGTWDGKACEMAVYVYYAQVKFTDGSEEFLKGNVTLVR
jgi:gliding motility-associated-like protein